MVAYFEASADLISADRGDNSSSCNPNIIGKIIGWPDAGCSSCYDEWRTWREGV
jgi:hypothetical protein